MASKDWKRLLGGDALWLAFVQHELSLEARQRTFDIATALFPHGKLGAFEATTGSWCLCDRLRDELLEAGFQ